MGNAACVLCCVALLCCCLVGRAQGVQVFVVPCDINSVATGERVQITHDNQTIEFHTARLFCVEVENATKGDRITVKTELCSASQQCRENPCTLNSLFGPSGLSMLQCSPSNKNTPTEFDTCSCVQCSESKSRIRTTPSCWPSLKTFKACNNTPQHHSTTHHSSH